MSITAFPITLDGKLIVGTPEKEKEKKKRK
jgi:hypothetical protein